MLKSRKKTPGAGGEIRRFTVPIGILAAAAFIGTSCTDMTGSADSAPAQLAVSARGSTSPVVYCSTLAQLRSMALTGNYRLTKNITMTSGDAGFTPIGSPFNPFRGTFDGNGFTINNFRTANNSNPGWYRGMFSSTNGAILKKVRLTNVNVAGEAYTGAIVGYMNNTLLTDSYVTGTVSGMFNANAPGYALGMAIGYAGSYSEIRRSYATGSIAGVVLYMGGFIGQIYGSGSAGQTGEPRVIVDEVFTNVNVNATPPGSSFGSIDAPTGGLAGMVQGAVITNIYAVGPVKGRGSPGGIVGRVVNNDPNSPASILHQAVYIGDVASTSGPARAGAIGSMSGNFEPGSRCMVFYNKTVDGGVAIPTSDITCNAGKTTQELQSARPSPNKVLTPYIIGGLVTQDMIGGDGFPPCKLASGTDGDWGFGTCGEPVIWRANASNQYNTLANIPNATSVQPLQ